MQVRLWFGVAACVAIAAVSGIAQWRRGRRRDLNRIGIVEWPLVQLIALVAALLIASVALNIA